MSFKRIGIIGAGAWGTALALCAARARHNVVLWGRSKAHIQTIQETRRNETYLPGITLPETVVPTAQARDLKTCGLYLAVIPAQKLIACLKELRLENKAPVVICAKGFDHDSGAFLSDQAKEILPQNPVGILSGPGFALDVARGLPTAVSLAFEDQKLGADIAGTLASDNFRPYFSTDVRGVEIGGALKNVLAIAAGIVSGRGLGLSARAALITRGFAEMQRFGLAYKARPETFGGLSGLGDLLLTATSEQSRNLRFGIALGEGKAIQETKEKLGTIEGIATAHAARLCAQKIGIDMPITEAVARIVEGRENIDSAIARLLSRPLKSEHA